MAQPVLIAAAPVRVAVERSVRRIEIASPKALDHLNVIRGMAALAVVVGHVRGLFFVSFAGLHGHGPVLLLFYFLTSLGRQAVMVFFVLSGFFIGWAVIGSVRSGRWSWRGYLIRRLSRLGIVLLPALVLTAFWDLAGISLFGAHSAYLGGRPEDSVIRFRVVDNLSLLAFFGNLFFLQGIHGIPTFGSNAPLWSLSYEFWYYMLFPLMVCAYISRGPSRWLFVVMGALIFILIGPTIAAYYLVWLLGVLIVVCTLRLGPRRLLLQRWTIVPAFLLLCVAVVVSQRQLIPAAEGLLGLVCAIFLTVLLLQRGSPEWGSRVGQLYAAMGRRLAGCSYTLYLVHLPLLIFLRAGLSRSVPWQPDLRHLLYGLVILGVVIAFAVVVASVTEARTDRLRGWLVTRFPLLA